MRLRFVDRLVALAPERSIEVTKNVTFEEAMLVRPRGGRGVPPTLLLEWLGQAAALLVAESTDYRWLPVIGSFASCRFASGKLVAGDAATVRIAVRSWRADAMWVDGEVGGPRGRVLAIERAVCPFVSLEKLWDPEELRAAARAARGEFPGPVAV
jgi:3-hydroxymyristoyl/3-hydroxydecanoyl-(acyl carrier protein) dehydratase